MSRKAREFPTQVASWCGRPRGGNLMVPGKSHVRGQPGASRGDLEGPEREKIERQIWRIPLAGGRGPCRSSARDATASRLAPGTSLRQWNIVRPSAGPNVDTLGGQRGYLCWSRPLGTVAESGTSVHVCPAPRRKAAAICKVVSRMCPRPRTAAAWPVEAVSGPTRDPVSNRSRTGR